MEETNNINPIGGYFELELPHFDEYHSEAIALNSGRFCLEYLLRCRKYKKVYLPYFTCETMIEPMEKLNIEYEFYHIKQNMSISDDIMLRKNEAIIYVNYWGLQNQYCKHLASVYGKQLILDYTQSFYSKPVTGIDTFYSCRKFFGVPDGSYLYTDAKADFEIEQDLSYTRMNSLVKRIDISPEAGYKDFHDTNAIFSSSSICKMSNLTKRMMTGIDYQKIAQRRTDNYNLLYKQLGGKKLTEGEVPMIFPFSTNKGQELRKHLIDNKVFVAKYWPNVESWTGKDSLETWLSNHVLPLPIDQRYDETDMQRIIDLILS